MEVSHWCPRFRCARWKWEETAGFLHLIVTNTWFQHKPLHQATWYRNGDRSRPGHMLDYVLINSRFRTCVLDTRVFSQLTLSLIMSLSYLHCGSRLRQNVTRREFLDGKLTISLMQPRLLSKPHSLMLSIVWTSRVMQSRCGRPSHQPCMRHMSPCQSCRDDAKLIG